MKPILSVTVAVLLAALLTGAWWLSQANDYQVDGTIPLPVLDAPVVVTRDANGIAHIDAQNRRDMLRAQGFVTAQDRLFQMEFFRMLAWGRLAELLGEQGVESDRRMRVFGLPVNGRRMAAAWSPDVRQFFGDYVDGVNAYIASRTDEHPLELTVLGHTPAPWTLEDIGVLLQFVSLSHSVNLGAEAVAQALLDTVGPERAAQVLPLNVNPDREPEALPVRLPSREAPAATGTASAAAAQRARPVLAASLRAEQALLHIGSNNWVVGPDRSASGKAIVVNDPHLDARLLPGPWYPVSMSTPDFQAAGVALPVLPGLMIGRTDRVAFGVTNGYGDVQDLFIETQAPGADDHYLEDGRATPFELRTETLRIKDEDAEGGFREQSLTVRSTRRGPVISDHGFVDLGDRVVSLRWGAAEAFGPEVGFDQLLFARSAREVDGAIQRMDIHMFNIVFADVDGNFGRRSSGRIPVRTRGAGALPVAVTDGGPYWRGWIPKDEMPGEFNPARGWSGTANHDTRPTAYPYSYSTYFSPSYRYRRISALLTDNDASTPSDHWRYMRDVHNLQAARLVPVLLPLLRDSGHDELANELAAWEHNDRAAERAPGYYQDLYRGLALATFRDELGEPLTRDLLGTWYTWQERFDAMVIDGTSPWFDKVDTGDTVETLGDLVAEVADAVDLSAATWGDRHQLRFVSPLRQSGLGSDFLGGGSYPMAGSGETVKRARYAFNKPYDVAFFASFNMVADLAEDQLRAALPGGVAARLFHDHYRDLIPDWHAGKPLRIPLSGAVAAEGATSRLTLTPATKQAAAAQP
ncbi:MAG: penicillin acylase family protein [Chromatocurvus sp.]